MIISSRSKQDSNKFQVIEPTVIKIQWGVGTLANLYCLHNLTISYIQLVHVPSTIQCPCLLLGLLHTGSLVSCSLTQDACASLS